MKPIAPALATAATRSALATHCRPPCTMGWSTPNISVTRVRNICLPPLPIRSAGCRRR